MTTAPHTIEVTGALPFPWDMLRYDQACPADTSAASQLETIARNRGMVPRDERPMTIKLNSYNLHPTPERWASFSWACKVLD